MNRSIAWAAIVLLGLAPPLLAQSPAPGKSPDKRPARTGRFDKGNTLTPERERVTLKFVRAQHSELADLIVQLKSNSQDEYLKAMLEIARSAERLSSLKDRDPPRYELELRAWQLDSRIRLLTARLTMVESEQFVEELRDLLRERNDVERARQVLERQRLVARLQRIEAILEKDPEEQIQQSLNRLLRTIQTARAKNKPVRVKPIKD